MTRLQDGGAVIQKNDSDLKPPYPVFFVGSLWSVVSCPLQETQSVRIEGLGRRA